MTYVRMTPNNVELCVKESYDQLLKDIKQVIQFKCPICGKLYEAGEYFIEEHLLDHAIEDRINELFFKQGKTLKEINDLYHIFDALIKEAYDGFKPCHYNITKNNCFVIRYLQCCDFPAYQIVHIHRWMELDVWGNGSWSGRYRTTVGLSDLGDPRPLSELYVYGKK